MDFEIDPMSAASPDMDTTDFAALKQSIADLGQLVSIVAANGKIIDGRKRYRACLELGKVPSVIELPIGADPGVHVVALNLMRTQYTASQRSMYAAAIATRSRADSLKVGSRSAMLPIGAPTTRQAAESVGVSPRQVTEAKAVRRDAVPEVIAAVERGDLTLYSARVILDTVPRAKQASALAHTLATPRHRDGRRHVAEGLGKGTAPRMHRRAKGELAGKAIAVLAHAAEELEAALEGFTDFAHAQQWLPPLDRIASTIKFARTMIKGGGA